MPNKIKGFTLIELLVVIAIIGILSGMIFVSMRGGETAAKDARVKSAMDQIRMKAVILKDADTDYGRVNCANESISLLCTDIQTYDNSSETNNENIVMRGNIGGGTNSGYCATTQISASKWICIDYKMAYNTAMDAQPNNCKPINCGGAGNNAANVCTCN